MKDKMSSISVAMATCNGGRFLQEQLDSIIAQSYPPAEVIVCDDSSSDNTVEILERFARRANLKIHFNKQRLGPVKSFETALCGCTSDYIAIADQDDVWLPEKLEKSLRKISTMAARYDTELPLLVFSDLQVVSDRLEPIATSFWQYAALNPCKHTLPRLLTGNCITGCTILMNRQLMELALPFGKNTLMHDYWLALAAAAFGRIDYLNFPTVLYRQHGDNCLGARQIRVSGSISRKLNLLYRYLIRHEFDGFLDKNILQAADFLERFNPQLQLSARETLRQFISLASERGLAAVIKMLKYDFLRSNIPESIELLLKYGCRKK